MIETTSTVCTSCGSVPPMHFTGCIKGAWPSEESKLQARIAELEADVELRMKPWQQREIWATMRRAEPAMRDELLSAWHDRDSAIASRDALAEQVEAVRAIIGDQSEDWRWYDGNLRAAIRRVLEAK